MNLEKYFAEAAFRIFSKRKLLLTFATLALSGILTVFCRALAAGTSPWVSLSMIFLPILLSCGLFLALGTLLVQIYRSEVKSVPLSLKQLLSGSIDTMLGTSYLSLPPVLIYLLLWIVLGFFILLKEIPFIGSFFNIIFAFGPFLLIFCSMVLCLFNLFLLFFIAPAAAQVAERRFDLAKQVGKNVLANPLLALKLFMIALIPAFMIGAMLGLSVWATQLSFSVEGPALALALEWFFVMLPFAAVMTPAVIFFFQFSSESYYLLQRK